MLMATPWAWAVALMSAQDSSVTRTARTQPSSKLNKPSSAQRRIPPTLPPGFLGVERGEPTVPNRKESVDIKILFDQKYWLKRAQRGGPRIKKPMIAAEVAVISTAAAPTSFPTLAGRGG